MYEVPTESLFASCCNQWIYADACTCFLHIWRGSPSSQVSPRLQKASDAGRQYRRD